MLQGRLVLAAALVSSLVGLACSSAKPPPDVIVLGREAPPVAADPPPLLPTSGPETSNPSPPDQELTPPAALADPPPVAPRPRDAVRDPRISVTGRRPVALVVTELSGLENLFGATPTNAPDRAVLARRLAEDYVELSHVARADAGAKAAERAIRYYGLIRTDYPAYAQGDEVAYFLGYEYERAGDVASARRAYFDVIAKYPSSRWVPYAYFAFGELFLAEADADPSKFELALQAFQKVTAYSKSDVAPQAMLRIGTIHARRGEKAEAANAFERLRREYPSSPAADGAPRL